MQPPLPVQWVKSVSGDFLDLLRVDLTSSYFASSVVGVYVIWYTGVGKSPVIRVGQGNIRAEITARRADPQIIQFSGQGQLKISWIVIDPNSFDGVEAYLYDYYKPLVGERKQVTRSIPVTPLLSL